MKKTLLFFCLFLTLAACKSDTDEHKQIIPTSFNEWDFKIDFPETGSEIVKSVRTNPDYPESKTINWVMEGHPESGYFIYFLAKDIIAESMREDVQYFDNGYYELLETVIGGGMKNFSGANIQYEKIDCDSLYIMKATADFEGSNGMGFIVFKAYTNGYQLLTLGAVNENPSDSSHTEFFNSLNLKNKSKL